MSTTRGYLTNAQYQAITGAEALGDDADVLIGHAETIVDGYLGAWPSFHRHIQGVAAQASQSSLILQPDQANLNGIDYLAGLVIEFQSGAAVGEYRVITSSTKLGVISFDRNFTETPQAGDVYHMYQMGKIPRAGHADITSLTQPDGVVKYLRNVPKALSEAVAWQLVYMQEMGVDYFNGNAMNLDSENFGSYSYTKSDGAKNGGAMVAPRAKDALRGSGLINRTGQIVGW